MKSNRDINKIRKSRPSEIGPLITALNFFHPLSEEMIRYFEQKLVLIKCTKQTLLLQSGDICKYIYFIKKGLVRGFIKEGGKDITTWITADNELVTSIHSLDLEVPALENMQAIEDCEFLALSSRHLKQLYIQYPDFNITARKLLQHYYRDAERRALLIRHANAVFKYHFFLENYSHLSNRVPIKYISSFLGIAFETLSRVRKKMATSAK
ncbi:Crp/Fnr family transcriptional regulator [Agriterribacter sp.]|uniref:Crp/Fnr family transcriptional regulator n=1 Tax=Agriterribacter sp. TaxID=2821509 RepID=UPI002D0DB6DC|nr:Crp/Fnr family transcriptional regulator [Agriterribacter sp.]HTN07762.1 Crp/Fnr family transcriptional regulator [Agriterribacter sp.]